MYPNDMQTMFLKAVLVFIAHVFETVLPKQVWRCLREQGVPEKYVRLVKGIYEDTRTQVNTSIEVTGNITVRVGLHQGSSLSP